MLIKAHINSAGEASTEVAVTYTASKRAAAACKVFEQEGQEKTSLWPVVVTLWTQHSHAKQIKTVQSENIQGFQF